MDPTTPAEPRPALSRRQRQVAALIAQGVGYKTAAVMLDIAPATVKNHLTCIYKRLDLDPGRSPAIQLAVLAASHRLDLDTGQLAA
jgi:DNA-binding NarL/FixJ family response regulator